MLEVSIDVGTSSTGLTVMAIEVLFCAGQKNLYPALRTGDVDRNFSHGVPITIFYHALKIFHFYLRATDRHESA